MASYDPQRIRRLLRLFIFQAPPAGPAAPRTASGLARNSAPPLRVRPGLEAVELILSGRGAYRAGEDLVECGPGDLLWHREGEETLGHHDPGQPYRCLAFRFQVDPAIPCPAPRRARWPDLDLMAGFAREAIAWWSETDLDRHLMLHAVHARLLVAACSSGPMQRPGLPAALVRMLARIESDHRSDLSLQDLARSAGCAPQRLHELCRLHLGSTPHRLLVDRRLRTARELLATTSDALEGIAAASGFSSPATLCRSFRQANGMSPGAWRRKLR